MNTNLKISRNQNRVHRLQISILLLLTVLVAASGCSVKGYTTKLLADALSESGETYASDEDVELVGKATPFALKTMEMILVDQPEHRGLLLAASSSFTQYAYLYVEWPAAKIEEKDVILAYRQRDRARRLYLRARDYGLQGLEVDYPGFSNMLRMHPEEAVKLTDTDDVPLLYWTAASWAAAISLGKDDPFLLADLPLVEALIDRALVLDESFGQGSIHTFLIHYEMNRQGVSGDGAARARKHYSRAVELSGGALASPHLALAESVSIASQNRAEFEQMLARALAVDVSLQPRRRLENLAMQERADWLLKRIDHYFSE